MAIDLREEARKLSEGETRKLAEGEDFTIFITRKNKPIKEGTGRLHTCEKDEFFLVLEGEGEILVEDKTYYLKEGEGYMVPAGKKHTTGTPSRVCWLWISKHPHRHVFF